MILWCLQSRAWHENSLNQWIMCLLLCFVHSYSIKISTFVWFFTLYSCQTTQKWQATNPCTHYILAKAIAILLHSMLIRISSGSILIYTFSGITGTCYGFRLKLFGVKLSLIGNSRWQSTTYLTIHLMFLLCIFGLPASVYFLISHSLARQRKLSYFQSPSLSPYYFKNIWSALKVRNTKQLT